MNAVLSPSTAGTSSSTRPLRVVHVISNLMTGGAETMLYKLLAATPSQRHRAEVVSLLGTGTVGPRLAALGIPVFALEMRRLPRLPGAMLALSRKIGGSSADVVVGWMYHGNLAASIAMLARHRRVIWNVRHSVYDLADEKSGTARVIRLCATLSHRAAAIVYNSVTAREQHEGLGYASDRGLVIPNGFDVDRFAPDAAARSSVRAELGLPPETPLVGMLARLHPMKDHVGLLRAFALLRERHSGAHLLLAGRDVTSTHPELASKLRELSLVGHVHLLGERADTPRLAAALDVAVSSSWSEGMPNAVGEAMACGVPCVVTDVGDSARLVGTTGIAVAPRDPAALAASCGALLDTSMERRRELGASARQRIVEHYAIFPIAQRFQSLFDAVAVGATLPNEAV